jgi:hypothetical protein
MEEYFENSRLPSAIEQKYSWSCEICTIKEALNYLLKANISEDDILSRITAVDATGSLLADVMRDKPEIRIAKPNSSQPHLWYVGLVAAVRSLCKGRAEANFLKRYDVAYFLKKKRKDSKKRMNVFATPPTPDFIRGIDRGLDDEVKYQVMKEMLEEDGVVIASGSRKGVNGIDTGYNHAFMVSGVGKEGGEQFAKVIDTNYKRWGLSSEYLVPLNKLSLDIVFYKTD